MAEVGFNQGDEEGQRPKFVRRSFMGVAVSVAPPLAIA